MSKIINTGSGDKKRRIRKRPIVVTLVLLAVIGLGAFVYTSPKFRESISSAVEQALDPASGVCSDNKDLIARYNGTVRDKSLSSLEGIGAEVRQTAGYKEDITCVYISMVDLFFSSNQGAAYAEYTTYMSLIDNGKTVSRSIKDSEKVDRTVLLDILKTTLDKPENPNGIG